MFSVVMAVFFVIEVTYMQFAGLYSFELRSFLIVGDLNRASKSREEPGRQIMAKNMFQVTSPSELVTSRISLDKFQG